MPTVGDLAVRLTANSTQFRNDLNSVRGSMRSFVSSMTRIAAPLAGLFGVGASLRAASEDIRAQKKLEAVFRSTGHAAGFSANEIKEFASELQKVTNFGDEATVSAAAMLGTFKQVRGDVFKGAIRAAMDMSEVMEQDLKSSVVQLGKALNDPIKGISALTRVGVSFTDEQKNLIKSLQDSGKLMEAQKVILAELNSEFGGAAEEMADPVTQLKNQLGDMAEIVGKDLLPSLKWIKNNMPGAIDATATAIGKGLESVGVLDPVLTRGRGDGINPFTGEDTLRGPLRIGEVIDPEVLRADPGDFLARQQREQSQRATQDAIGEGILSGARAVNGLQNTLGSLVTDFSREVAIALPKAQEWADDMREVGKLFEMTRTPMERFTADSEKLLDQFARGKIGEDLLRRGISKAGEGLDLDRLVPQTPTTAAVDALSSEGITAIQQALQGGQFSTPEKETAAGVKKLAEIEARIERILREQLNHQKKTPPKVFKLTGSTP